MKNIFIIIFLLNIALSSSYPQITQDIFVDNIQTGFVQNLGQLKNPNLVNIDSIYYYFIGQNLNIYFHKDKISFVLKKRNINRDVILNKYQLIFNDSTIRIDLTFPECSKDLTLKASDKNLNKLNIYYGNDRYLNLQSYSKIIYSNIYEGIDLIFELNSDYLDFKITSKSIVLFNDFKMKFLGCDSIYSDGQSLIFLKTNLGLLGFKNNIFGNQINIYCYKDYVEFKQNKTNVLNGPYELNWSTHIGGYNVDVIRGLATDDSNNIYAVGFSSSYNFPTTTGVVQPNHSGIEDIVIMKLSQSGNLIWSTYLGGDGSDGGTSIVCSKRKKILISGETRSYNFPITMNAIQKNFAGGTSDAFFSVLTPDGMLEYSTYYGSSVYDVFGTVKEDSYQNIWLFGNTWGENFPTTQNSYQSYNRGYYDAVLVKFDSSYNLLYSTYFGAEHDDFGHYMNIDNNNDIIITGYTSSKSLPTNNSSYKINLSGPYDCYLAKFNNIGKLLWCTYFGGSGEDVSSNIVTDDFNNIYLRGITNSTDLPVSSNSFQSKIGRKSDVFVAKFLPDNDLDWCTYFGGNDEDGPLGYDLHAGGLEINKNKTKLIISGRTKSSNLYLTENAFQRYLKGNFDAFLFEFDTNGKPLWSSYFGGSLDDIGYWVSYDKYDNIIFAGTTLSSDFPTKNTSFQNQFFGNYEGFIVKIGDFPSVSKDSCFSVIDYPNFLIVKDLLIIGNSFKKDSIIRLTDTRLYQTGAVWHSKKVNVADGFSTKFAFKLSQGNNNDCNDNSLPGADGLAFVIQNTGNLSLGWTGGGLGYDGISNSLAVEFDTFNNDSTQIENLFDPNGNHIAVQSCGNTLNTAKHNKDCNIAINKNIFPLRSDGTIYYSKVDYHIKDSKFTVFLDTLPLYRFKVIELDNFDIGKLLNLDQNKFAYVGFTAATGCAVENHDLLAWDFCTLSKNILDITFDYSKEAEFSFDIFPNPVQDELMLKFYVNQHQLISLEIFNLLGSKIYSENVEASPQNNIKLKLDAKQLPIGTYYCKIICFGKPYIKKFIKTE
ncbi:MAG: SBBP repeat-containing protein [Candidatus Kapabacteria bacterium]|nr:SBBP repeat-containing protein [Candidatus Kapabacteria bacterium]